MPNEKFDDWMEKVDSLFEQEIGLNTQDLPDWGYYDSWFAGDSPREAMSGYVEDNFDEMSEFAHLI